MLDALKATVAIAPEKDVIMTFGPWESDVYTIRIEQAYLDITASGAWMFHASMVDDNGRKINFSECLASNKTGTLKTTYTDKKGNEVILPGYAKVLNVMHLAVDADLPDLTSCEVATKAIKIRQRGADGQMADAIVEKPVFVDLIGQTLQAGILKVTEDKFSKNEATGRYDIPNGTRDVNTFDKFFNEEGFTLQEATGGLPSTYRETWLTNNKGKTRNKAKNKPIAANGSAPAGAPAAPVTPATAPLSWS